MAGQSGTRATLTVHHLTNAPSQGAPGLMRGLVKGFVDPHLKMRFDYREAELGKSAWFAGPELSA